MIGPPHQITNITLGYYTLHHYNADYTITPPHNCSITQLHVHITMPMYHCIIARLCVTHHRTATPLHHYLNTRILQPTPFQDHTIAPWHHFIFAKLDHSIAPLHHFAIPLLCHCTIMPLHYCIIITPTNITLMVLQHCGVSQLHCYTVALSHQWHQCIMTS